MIGNLSRRERILVGLAIAVGVILGGWLLVIEPILEHNRSAGELVPAREQVLLQKRELIARRAAINAELESTTTRFDKLAEGFLTSATPAVAAPQPPTARPSATPGPRQPRGNESPQVENPARQGPARQPGAPRP